MISSVYGICEVNKNGNVSYSGDTFIRIRSGKRYVECFNLQFVVDCLINHELEVENFRKAVDVLSQVWEKTVIDGYLVYWRAVPVGKAYKPPNPDPVWVEIDPAWVQIVKYHDKSCCSPLETNWLKTIPQRFIPFPAVYEYCENGYKAMEPCRYFKKVSNHSNFAPLTHRLLLQDIHI